MGLAEAIDGARLVMTDYDEELVLAWFGGHGVHAYTYEGNEVAFWNVGDFSQNDAHADDVEDSMHKRMENGDYIDFC